MLNIQTRSSNGEFRYFATIKSAHKYSLYDDESVWKISWSISWSKDKNGRRIDYRFRKKYKDDKWLDSSEDKLNQMNEIYRNCSDKTLFWVNQKIVDFDLLEQRKDFKIEEDWDMYYMPQLIIELLSDEEFRTKYIK